MSPSTQARVVRLKPIPPQDLPALAQGSVPASLAGQVIADGLPPPAVARRIQQRLAAGQPAHWVGMCYILDAAGCCIGGCGFKALPQQREVEVGYGLAEARRGLGYASAALQELLLMAAVSGQIDAVVAHISSNNLASARLASRAGFVPGETVLDDGEWVVRWRRALTPADTVRTAR